MEPQHQRLDEAMRRRRLALGMRTWRQLAEAAKISYETLRAVRNGSRPADGTADGLDRALQWEPGSVESILRGGEPRERSSALRTAGVMATSEMIAAAQEELNELERLDEELHRRMEAARRTPTDLKRAVTALRLIQGDEGETPTD